MSDFSPIQYLIPQHGLDILKSMYKGNEPKPERTKRKKKQKQQRESRRKNR